MDKKIRDAIDRSLEELKDIQDKVDDFIDDLPDDTKELKSTVKNVLGQINSLLSTAVEQASDKTEEAQLQAHLGLMEARDKLDASRVIFDDFLDRSSEESKTLMDEVELKRRLAMIEAKNFWEEHGSKLAEEFQASADNMQRSAEEAMGELRKTFSQWNEFFTKDK